MGNNIDTNVKLRIRDWRWIVSILIAIIICLLTIILLNIHERISFSNVISIGSGLVSISLAIVAIIMVVAEGIKSSNKEEKVQVGLDKIITNTNSMSELIQMLKKEVLNTHIEVKSFRRDYIEGVKTFKVPNENSQEFEGIHDNNAVESTATNPENVEIEKAQPKDVSRNQSHGLNSPHNIKNLMRGEI
ncbi:hypothetical protein [Alteribacter aurantiacus]|uniref:hypothetical protein n=1 Tax=Alteribacter aurantiacus TaxID=254410 RepID=UPI0003F9E62C